MLPGDQRVFIVLVSIGRAVVFLSMAWAPTFVLLWLWSGLIKPQGPPPFWAFTFILVAIYLLLDWQVGDRINARVRDRRLERMR